MSVGERIAFCQLLEKGARIEIPIIQRDYAQGRESASEVREQFLSTIHDTLIKQPEDLEQPLDLDFVYGSLDGESSQKFSPLDGQQRLTTLFLLHWYLACIDGELEAFRAMVLDGNDSRFTYQTRTSSTEFFNALAKAEFNRDELVNFESFERRVISKRIMDMQWFFLSWNQDPTIQSALVMLDAIQKKFSTSEGLYSRITQTEKPYVTFQFLNLREFGLSDELYIKMNARGKPLTQFENFKARLEQHIDVLFPNELKALDGREISLKKYFSHQIDTQWADLFWAYKNIDSGGFDDEVMNFIRSLSSVYYRGATGWNQVQQQLRDGSNNFSFLKYAELNVFDGEFITAVIKILDALSVSRGGLTQYILGSPYYDEIVLFKKSLMRMSSVSRLGMDYGESVLFFAYCKYIENNSKNIDAKELREWMRIISNLTVNTPYNNLGEFQRSLNSVSSVCEHSNGILEYIASYENYQNLEGFYAQQIREEHIKANLILKDAAWERAILNAEQHGYFKGQIEFILSFSGILDYFLENKDFNWSDEENTAYLEKFNAYYVKASTVFNSESGLKHFPDFLWERALLATGNYLIEKGRNLSFLDNTDRDVSWKRLLRGADQAKDSQNINGKRGFIKTVLDKFDPEAPEQSLQAIVDNASIADLWRKMIVSQPRILLFCTNRFIRKSSDTSILLLTKSKTSGYYLELYTFYLMLTKLEPMKAAGELKPFGVVRPYPVNAEDDSPGIIFEGCKINGYPLVFKLLFHSGKYLFQLKIPTSELVLKPLRAELMGAHNYVQDHAENYLILSVATEAFESSLSELLQLLRARAGSSG